MVHLNADEGRGGAGVVALVHTELQHAEHDARHKAPPEACHGVHGQHRQLAEEGQHEVLQQAVPEHAHPWRLLPRLYRAAAKLVLHRRADLQPSIVQGPA